MKKRSILLGIAAASVMSICTYAADIKVVVNGANIDFTGEQAPVIQDGRTLVPFRAVFEKMGAKVNWDDKEKLCIAQLGDKNVNIAIDSTAVSVNGKVVTNSDVPAKIMNGRTMVPLRVLSESIGANVDWNSATKTVTVNTTASSAVPSSGIDEEKAKSIALADSGINASDAQNISVHKDMDDGRELYDVTFFSGNTKYEYEIDAVSGAIRSADRDNESANKPMMPRNDLNVTVTPGKVDAEQARNIALSDAGLTAEQVSGLKTDLDYDDGRTVYEIEFYANGMEYNYEINAADGRIIDKEAERD